MRNQTSEKNNKAVKAFYVSTPVEYKDRDGEVKTSWTTIGRAFEGKSGMTVVLNALPVSGKLFIGESKDN